MQNTPLKMTSEENRTYQCKDLMLSAAFLACDIQLLDLEPMGKYYMFVFDSPEECEKIRQKWLGDNLYVSATKFAAGIKKLKNLIYSS